MFGALALAGCRDRGPGGDGGGTETDTGPSSNSDPTSDSVTDSDTDTEGETESDTNDTGPMVDFEPAEGGMRKLLYREYRDTVELLLGSEAAAVADPPIDIGGEGFDAVGAWNLAIGPVDVEDYEEIAGDVASAAIANKATLATTVPCVMNGDNACFETVARVFGRFAFRRTLEDIEVEQLVEIARAGQDFGGDFDSGLRYELMAVLQAPSFLYIQQIGEPDPGSGYRLLTGTELAARMAFFLTGKTPTIDLLDRAEAGELDSGAGIRDLANELITDPGARTAIAAFFDEALRTPPPRRCAEERDGLPQLHAPARRVHAAGNAAAGPRHRVGAGRGLPGAVQRRLHLRQRPAGRALRHDPARHGQRLRPSGLARRAKPGRLYVAGELPDVAVHRAAQLPDQAGQVRAAVHPLQRDPPARSHRRPPPCPTPRTSRSRSSSRCT